MDNIKSSNSQARPLWERQKSQRGHRSAVDRALEAHRKRSAERQERTQTRLNMVRGLSNQFFTPNVANDPQTINETIQAQPVVAEEPVAPQAFAAPRGMELILDDASLGSNEDKALILVDKEISNPEESPLDEVPKGSYIDYQV
ncbi:MAG: hypothetical protein AAF203_09785 [Pseudomonadota bacterium]